MRGRGSQVASQVSRDSEREGASGVNKEGKAHRVRNLSAEALKGGPRGCLRPSREAQEAPSSCGIPGASGLTGPKPPGQVPAASQGHRPPGQPPPAAPAEVTPSSRVACPPPPRRQSKLLILGLRVPWVQPHPLFTAITYCLHPIQNLS